MSTSKAPAYFGLVCAVAIGVLLSGANNRMNSDVVAPLDVASTPAAVIPAPAEPQPVPVAEWKLQTLSLGTVRLKANLPSFGINATCMLPKPTEDEVATCQPATGTVDTSIWQVRTVSQRDRFVPISWFDSAVQALRALPPDLLTRQLGNEANLVSKAGFTNAALLSPVDLPGAVAIRGAAAAPSSFSAAAPQLCVYAFLLVANRPTTVLYCATDDVQSLAGSKKIVASLLKFNASGEYKRGSAQGIEHALFLKRLKAAGGAVSAPELVSSEQAFEQSMASECERYPVLSQERFQCYEGFAANRLSAL
ncbi:hypothetical protein [Paraburkholderia sp. RL17-347-BIC-D]|uniref:hypothetical protein n=1 Tax=Paraburkholderia sp. RL17-347-BIC-D TaxID=3031632 RepID=UPI0038B97FAD